MKTYIQFEEEPDDDKLIPFDELGLDTMGDKVGFDYRSFEENDEEEEQEWEKKSVTA